MTQPICQAVGSVVVGVVAAAILGVAPGPAAAMALLASSVTYLAIPALQKLPTIEDADSKREIIATFLIFGAWCASMTQISQIFLNYAGYSVPFLQAAAISTAAIAIRGEWLYKLVNREEKVFD